jgi:hypothetical protein
MAITSFDQLQEKISALGLRVSVRRKGEALYLRAVLPPRPGSKSQQTEPHQQDLTLKVQANRYGFEVALEKAIALGLALGRGEFNWNDYLEPIAPQLNG